MRIAPLLLAFVLCPLLWSQEGNQLEADRWFVGELNGQPAVSLHEVCTRKGDGGRTSAVSMAMVIKRTLGKSDPASRFEVRDTQVFEEDASGDIVSFKFDHEEGGTRTSATGRVTRTSSAPVDGGDGVTREVVATVYRLGRKTEVRLPIPAGAVLVGDRRSQEMLAKIERAVGEQARFTSVGLLNNRVILIVSTATFAGHDERGQLLYDVVSDAMPIPMRLRLTPKGELAGMT
ncbi:MAG: hypothetical protein H0V44_11385, partial [Planctomycetes bacterium]|nr:hypothetical protein [Planctomycetota bacterium]